MKHVHFVRGRYVVRVTVPPELRGVVGKRELVEPLGGDKKLAERKAHAVIGAFLARIEEARERREAMQPTLSSAAKAHFHGELETDARGRRGDEAMLVALRKRALSEIVRLNRILDQLGKQVRLPLPAYEVKG